MGYIPPKSKRFCVACETETVWSYNRTIGHSQCNKCGGRYGSDPDSYFTTVCKEKIKLQHELDKIKKNYIRLLEMFIGTDENLSNKFKRQIQKLYNPNIKDE